MSSFNMNEETVPDVKSFNATPANSSSISNEPAEEVLPEEPRGLLNPLDLYYDMTGEKYLHIFNHFKYENNSFYGPNAEKLQRDGTSADVTSLVSTFSRLRFKPIVHNDLRYNEVLEEMTKLCTMDHRATSCLAVAIMTHGQNGGVLLAADQPYNFSELTDILHSGHPSLIGKPKLCFVQACRSGHLDGSRMFLNESIILPKYSNTLVVTSSSPHYYSYRTPSGTWLMQSLCEVLNQHHQFFDLIQMLTLVNQEVANKSTYNSKNMKYSNKKQMPETKHTLTKLLNL